MHGAMLASPGFSQSLLHHLDPKRLDPSKCIFHPALRFSQAETLAPLLSLF